MPPIASLNSHQVFFHLISLYRVDTCVEGIGRFLMHDLDTLKLLIREFAERRDWNQFHSPKNLSMALIAEAGELIEHFQWLTEEQSANLEQKKLREVSDEIADIQIYLIRLSDMLGIDLIRETRRKISDNEQKYPAEKVKGSPKKYTEYE